MTVLFRLFHGLLQNYDPSRAVQCLKFRTYSDVETRFIFAYLFLIDTVQYSMFPSLLNPYAHKAAMLQFQSHIGLPVKRNNFFIHR